jgi:hypothetical protein
MKCDNCANKEICKHAEYMQGVEAKVNGLELDKNIPIRVDINCGYKREKNCNAENIRGLTSVPFKSKDIYGRPMIKYCE